jgi:hypothetical protein
MPWPEVNANTITTANGLRIEFVEPGREVRVSYASADGQTKLELTQTAVTPLFARGHVAFAPTQSIIQWSTVVGRANNCSATRSAGAPARANARAA